MKWGDTIAPLTPRRASSRPEQPLGSTRRTQDPARPSTGVYPTPPNTPVVRLQSPVGGRDTGGTVGVQSAVGTGL